MSKKINISMVIFLFLSLVILGCKGEMNLSGEWELDRQKTGLTDDGLFLAKIEITQKGDSLLTVRTYETGNGEQYPFDETLTLDGKEYEITVYDMPRKAAAQWAEDKKSIVVNSHITFYGDSGEIEFETKETWTLIEKGNVLSLASTTKSVRGESQGNYFYYKVQRVQ